MKVYPSIGSQLELTNLLSGEAFRARVVGTRRSTEGHVLGVAVEPLIPSETLWGVNFQLKKPSAELVRLNHATQLANMDPRILRERVVGCGGHPAQGRGQHGLDLLPLLPA